MLPNHVQMIFDPFPSAPEAFRHGVSHVGDRRVGALLFDDAVRSS